MQLVDYDESDMPRCGIETTPPGGSMADDYASDEAVAEEEAYREAANLRNGVTVDDDGGMQGLFWINEHTTLEQLQTALDEFSAASPTVFAYQVMECPEFTVADVMDEHYHFRDYPGVLIPKQTYAEHGALKVGYYLVADEGPWFPGRAIDIEGDGRLVSAIETSTQCDDNGSASKQSKIDFVNGVFDTDVVDRIVEYFKDRPWSGVFLVKELRTQLVFPVTSRSMLDWRTDRLEDVNGGMIRKDCIDCISHAHYMFHNPLKRADAGPADGVSEEG